MKIIQRLLSVALFCSCCLMHGYAVISNETDSLKPEASIFLPDFAFPKDVIATAESFLDANPPLKNPFRGSSRLLAAEELSLAKRDIDYKSVNSIVAGLLKLAKEETNPATRAMFLTYTARFCSDYGYHAKGYIVNPDPNHVDLWNYNAMRLATDSLYREAWLCAPEDVLLKDYDTALGEYDSRIGLIRTVRDFILSQWTRGFQNLNPYYGNDRKQGIQPGRIIDELEENNPIRFYTEVTRRNATDAREFITQNLNSPNVMYAVLAYLETNGVSGRNAGELYTFYSSLEQAQLPAWERDYIKKCLGYLKQPKGEIFSQKALLADRPFDINLVSQNTDSIRIGIYKFKNDPPRSVPSLFVPRNLYKSVVLHPNSGLEKDTVKWSVTLPAGYYAIKVGENDDFCKPQLFTIYPWLVTFIQSDKSRRQVQVLDAWTGVSCQGLTVKATRVKDRKEVKAKTDACGIATFGFPIDDDVVVVDSKSGMEFDYDCGYNLYYWDEDEMEEEEVMEAASTEERVIVSMMPDRPAYRPGEKVRVVIVARDSEKVLEGLTDSLKVSFFNPLFGSRMMSTDNKELQTIAVATAPTDPFGRTEAEFVLPSNVEPGSVALIWKTGYNMISVSDFKLPDVSITSDYILNKDSVEIFGYVLNSVEDPRPDTDVRLTVNYEVSDTTLTYNAITNAKGKFSFNLPRIPEDIELPSYWSTTRYTLEASTPDGYNDTAYGSYPLKYDATVRIKTDSPLNIRDGLEFTIDIERLGAVHNDEPQECRWALTNIKNDTILTGNAMEGLVVLPRSMTEKLTAGRYYLRAEALQMPCQSVEKSVILYNSERPQIPDDDAIFYIPARRSEVADGVAKIFIGTDKSDVTLWWMPVGNETSVHSLILSKGYQTIELEVNDASSVLLWTVKDGRSSEQTVEYDKVKPGKKLTLEIENFRDKTGAQSTQTWNLVTRLGDEPVSAAVVLDAYDLRLRSLYMGMSLYLEPSVYKYRLTRDIELFIDDYPDIISTMRYGYDFKLGVNNLVYLPVWRYLSSSSRFVTKYTYGVQDRTESVSVQDHTESVYLRGVNSLQGPVAGLAVRSASDLDDSVALNQVVSVNGETSESGDDATIIYGSRSPMVRLNDVKIRENTVFTALWRPMLTTDADGRADVTFEMPNQTSSWYMTATAWTPDLHNTTVSKTFTSTRPIYVRPNLPRFVRVGDRVSIVTSITNATDTVQEAGYDAIVSTDKTSGTISIPPGSMRMVTIVADITGQTALSDSLVFTFRASNGTYGDGERVAIPILPSTALVVESTPFYLNPGENTYTATLSNSSEIDEQSEFHFTANPMWTVVEALPEILRNYEDVQPIATQYAATWYVAQVAQRIVSKHPVVLNELDIADVDIEKIKKDALKELLELQKTDGGFYWGKWSSNASVHTTLDVLSWFDEDIDNPSIRKMKERALEFVDDNIVVKGQTPGIDFHYSVIRSAFGRPTTLQGQAVVDNTVNYIIKNWKSMGLGQKSISAMILEYNGYRAVASEILRSVAQFGTVKDNNRGFVFPNMPGIISYANLLRSFKDVDPDNQLIDAIRQGLLCYRRGADWGETAHTAYAIRTLLETGTEWVVPADISQIKVTIGGEPISLPKSSALTGAFSLQIPKTSSQNSDLRLHTDLLTPSYGATVLRRYAELSATASFGTKSLNIEKEIISQGELKPGDKATVRLRVYTDSDMSDVIITDCRSAAFEPVVQSGRFHSLGKGCRYYEQTTNTSTNLFVDWLPRGYSIIEYEVVVNNAGTFTTGVATLTSSQDPDLTAHTASTILTISQ